MFKLNLRFNSVTKENRKNFGCSTSTTKTARENYEEREKEGDERVLCNIKSCGLLDFNNSHGSYVCVCVFADTWRRRMTGKQSRAKFESETQPATEPETESNDEQDACIWSQQKTKFYLPAWPPPPLFIHSLSYEQHFAFALLSQPLPSLPPHHERAPEGMFVFTTTTTNLWHISGMLRGLLQDDQVAASCKLLAVPQPDGLD